jgi:hypothetical protein
MTTEKSTGNEQVHDELDEDREADERGLSATLRQPMVRQPIRVRYTLRQTTYVAYRPMVSHK